MTINSSGHRLWRVVSLLAALALVGTPGLAADPSVFHSVVVRGQSPYESYPSYYTPGQATFAPAPSPWITVSQPVGGPAPAYNSPTQTAQAPADPFAQPTFGVDPSFGGMPGGYDPMMQNYFSDSPAIWQPYASMQGNFGNERVMGIGQLMMPIYQDGQSLIFADIRGRFDDQDSWEGNFGLALRQLVDPNWFYGIYGFYDYKHTQFGNDFQQGTVGIEAMSVQYEARLNGYLPESGAKTANGASTTEFSGGTIFVNGGVERAYYGVDGEVGALLYEEWGGNLEFRGFVGGYWFDSSGANTKSVAGPKGRLEMRLYDTPWFGPESRLTLGVEVQNDSVRDFQVAGIVRLEVPLGFFQGGRKLSRIERRMLDRIVRDDDVITVASQGNREIGIDSLTNKPLVNVTQVDATTANIQNALNTAGMNSIVIANGAAGGITTNAALNLQHGQIFRGAGFQVIGSETGALATFGSRPTINNTNNAANTVVLANQSTVADLNLTGGSSGIQSGAALTGLLISGNTVTRSASDAFQLSSLDATSIVQNNTAQSAGRDANGAITNTSADGFEFNGTNAATVRGNSAINSGDSGFDVSTLTGVFDGNTATGNGGAGSAEGVGYLFTTLAATGVVSNNVANQNFNGGFRVSNAIPNGGIVTGNIANNNGRNAAGTIVTAAADGFQFTGALSGTVSNNSASFNADRGFEFTQNVAATGRVTGNSATQNFGRGFHFQSTLDAGSLVSGNTARGNGFNLNGAANPAGIDGFVFNGNVSGLISNNVSEGNQQAGYFIENLQAAGTVSGNTATNNPLAGFFFNTGVAGTVSGNTATGSAATNYGFDFVNGAANLAATARVTGNTSSFNDGGFAFNNIAAGALINGNTARGNGFTANGAPIAGSISGNGFEFFQPNLGIVTGNFALANANNGFSGPGDNNFNNAAGATFSNNTANTNGDRGFRGVNAGTAANNTGTGNTGGGNTFP